MLSSKYFFSKHLFFLDFFPKSSIFLCEEVTFNNSFTLFLLIFFYNTFLLVTNAYVIGKNPYILGKTNSSFTISNNLFLKNTLIFVIIVNLFLIFSLKGPDSSLWFSHITITYSQLKYIYVISALFCTVILFLLSESLTLSADKLDFYLSSFNLYFWLCLLFFCNNLFTFIFFLEILSISIMLMNSSSIFYSKESLLFTNFSNNLSSFLNIPYYKINSLLVYFWVSFFASVNLFLFLYFYIYFFLSLDQTLLEYVLYFEKTNFSFFSILPFFFTWYMLLSSIFIKCGLVPFYSWKPQFFKGLSYIYIFFYNVVYYFFTLVFLSLFLYSNFLSLVISMVFFNLILLFSGLLLLLTILYSVTYFKSFISFSSILNTLLLFTILTCSSFEQTLYF